MHEQQYVKSTNMMRLNKLGFTFEYSSLKLTDWTFKPLSQGKYQSMQTFYALNWSFLKHCMCALQFDHALFCPSPIMVKGYTNVKIYKGLQLEK